MICETPLSAQQLSDDLWRHTFSLPISTFIALGLSHVMCYINLCYLLTVTYLHVCLLAAEVRAIARYLYIAANDDELSMVEGDVITVLDQNSVDAGWWKGELKGRVGVFPDNFVELLPADEVRKHWVFYHACCTVMLLLLFIGFALCWKLFLYS